NRCNRSCVLDQPQPRWLAALLGRRLPDRADAELVGAAGSLGPARRIDLLWRMGGQADQGVGAGRLARLGDRRVVLAHVDTVGAAGGDQIGPIVEDEQRSVRGGRAAEGARKRDELVGAAVGLLA